MFLLIRIGLCTHRIYVVDSVLAALQPSRKVTPAEMVRGYGREAEEEVIARADQRCPSTQAQNVQLLGMERHEDCI